MICSVTISAAWECSIRKRAESLRSAGWECPFIFDNCSIIQYRSKMSILHPHWEYYTLWVLYSCTLSQYISLPALCEGSNFVVQLPNPLMHGENRLRCCCPSCIHIFTQLCSLAARRKVSHSHPIRLLGCSKTACWPTWLLLWKQVQSHTVCKMSVGTLSSRIRWCGLAFFASCHSDILVDTIFLFLKALLNNRSKQRTCHRSCWARSASVPIEDKQKDPSHTHVTQAVKITQ